MHYVLGVDKEKIETESFLTNRFRTGTANNEKSLVIDGLLVGLLNLNTPANKLLLLI